MLNRLKYWVKTNVLGRRFNATEYWEDRYASGGNSGDGSYDHLADYKAEIINDFIQEKEIQSMIELGCGDGNQFSLFNIDQYTGVDVAKSVIDQHHATHQDSENKAFHLYSKEFFQTNQGNHDLSASLDVIYHITDKEVYHQYLQDLFSSAKKHVIIYSSNFASEPHETASHIQHHEFTSDVARMFPEWELVQISKNRYPYAEFGPSKGSIADFYFFEKKEA